MLDFTAIDFATANSFRGSPCSVGLIRVCGGEVVEERQETCMADGSPIRKYIEMQDPVEVDIEPEMPGFTAHFLFQDIAPEIKEFFSK